MPIRKGCSSRSQEYDVAHGVCRIAYRRGDECSERHTGKNGDERSDQYVYGRLLAYNFANFGGYYSNHQYRERAARAAKLIGRPAHRCQ